MRGLLGWVNELPPPGAPGNQCLEESVDEYGQARGMCIQQRGHDGPHRTDAMRAEARGEKSIPRYQPARRGAYGVPIPEGLCGAYGADEGGEHMCRYRLGHLGSHDFENIAVRG